jgi:hypothetical protein
MNLGKLFIFPFYTNFQVVSRLEFENVLGRTQQPYHKRMVENDIPYCVNNNHRWHCKERTSQIKCLLE